MARVAWTAVCAAIEGTAIDTSATVAPAAQSDLIQTAARAARGLLLWLMGLLRNSQRDRRSRLASANVGVGAAERPEPDAEGPPDGGRWLGVMAVRWLCLARSQAEPRCPFIAAHR